ncbi:hypothetical protein GCM10027018_20270 [Paenibacillus thermoaerophilus]|nr:hypothetical protein [Paenibacillus thermoaerophilus]
MDILEYNREAWNKQVLADNPWMRPVTPEEIARAREGRWEIMLTPTKPVPRDRFPPRLDGAKVLCLASGGGQQGPISRRLGRM